MCRGLLKSFRFLKGASMTKYDIIIPIGSVCKTSQNLRDLKKQNESLPFDWIFVADLDMIYTALETHFADFLKLENMEYKCKESEQTDILTGQPVSVSGMIFRTTYRLKRASTP